MSQAIEIKVPDIDDVKDVEVIEVLVAVGDTIEAGQSLITVESDKASMEIPSPGAGVVKALKVKVGDKVSQGSIVLELSTDAVPAASAAKPVLRPQRLLPRPTAVKRKSNAMCWYWVQDPAAIRRRFARPI
jgi:pyruvate/2-oxoglutarate dehydrogenase complex dihydrolipoamide acyltransferase (E2) component